MNGNQSKSCTQALPSKKRQKKRRRAASIDGHDLAFPHGYPEPRPDPDIDGYDLAFPHGYPGELRSRPASRASNGTCDTSRSSRDMPRPGMTPRLHGSGEATHDGNVAPILNGAQRPGGQRHGSGMVHANGTGSGVRGDRADMLPGMLLMASANPAPCSVSPDERIDQPVPSGHTGERIKRHPLWASINAPSHPVVIPPLVLDLLADNQMLVMAQILFWFRADRSGKVRATVERDGYLWAAKTFAEIGREIHRKERQVKVAVGALKKRGFLVVEPHQSRFHGDKTVSHLRPDLDALAAAWSIVVAKDAGQAGVEEDLL